MPSSSSRLIAPLVLILSAGSSNVWAEHHERRQHGSHEHGAASLDIALEGKRLDIALSSPSANIVGFEYKARTKQDKQRLQQALASLQQADKLFITPAAAGCTLVDTHIENSQDGHAGHDDHGHDEHKGHGGHDDHGHGEHKAHGGHDDHGHGEHKGHGGHDDHGHGDHKAHGGHDDHGHSAHKGHGGHDDHGHGEHSDSEHSDIEAEYSFRCDNPAELTQLTLGLFKVFPAIERLDARLISDSGQKSVKMTPSTNTLRF